MYLWTKFRGCMLPYIAKNRILNLTSVPRWRKIRLYHLRLSLNLVWIVWLFEIRGPVRSLNSARPSCRDKLGLNYPKIGKKSCLNCRSPTVTLANVSSVAFLFEIECQNTGFSTLRFSPDVFDQFSKNAPNSALHSL